MLDRPTVEPISPQSDTIQPDRMKSGFSASTLVAIGGVTMGGEPPLRSADTRPAAGGAATRAIASASALTPSVREDQPLPKVSQVESLRRKVRGSAQMRSMVCAADLPASAARVIRPTMPSSGTPTAR